MGVRVTIVDLGLGNLRSVARAFERAGAEAEFVHTPDGVHRAERLVVPGQGSFRDGARALDAGLRESIGAVIDAGRPYLGICLGMQLLFEASEEAPEAVGLRRYDGRVRKFTFPPSAQKKVPHMGWNEVSSRHPLLPPAGWFYFVHSYYCDPVDSELTAATADYGGAFCAAIARDNVFACQFHPEKSHREGHRFLTRFLSQT